MCGSQMEPPTIGKEKVEEIIRNALQEPSSPKTFDYEEPMDWKDLQEKTAKIFKDLGCKTKVDEYIKGAKTRHKIDVWAIFDFGGIKYKIDIECKYWNRRVKKEQVSTLIGILADIGAEKGIIVSKKGFQKGAHRLAEYTNIDLLTFPELIEKSKTNIEYFKIHNTLNRIKTLKRPFLKFFYAMKEEAGKKDLFWYPSEKGSKLRGALSILQGKIEDIDLRKFPTAHIYSFLSKKDEEIWKPVNNREEYLNAIIDNLTIIEKEYEKYKKEIFSE